MARIVFPRLGYGRISTNLGAEGVRIRPVARRPGLAPRRPFPGSLFPPARSNGRGLPAPVSWG
ncbi:MAG: hypothetical protein MZV70_63430 [Desulfobacterales bacterium]|nr:hypothetical protein [Desulfobacterales bacterium]